jgi:lipopolysaccharide/colanic/teichoic acid biosynthesis glycosyltransferase
MGVSYIENCSVALDLKTLFKTTLVVFFQKIRVLTTGVRA